MSFHQDLNLPTESSAQPSSSVEIPLISPHRQIISVTPVRSYQVLNQHLKYHSPEDLDATSPPSSDTGSSTTHESHDYLPEEMADDPFWYLSYSDFVMNPRRQHSDFPIFPSSHILKNICRRFQDSLDHRSESHPTSPVARVISCVNGTSTGKHFGLLASGFQTPPRRSSSSNFEPESNAVSSSGMISPIYIPDSNEMNRSSVHSRNANSESLNQQDLSPGSSYSQPEKSHLVHEAAYIPVPRDHQEVKYESGDEAGSSRSHYGTQHIEPISGTSTENGKSNRETQIESHTETDRKSSVFQDQIDQTQKPEGQKLRNTVVDSDVPTDLISIRNLLSRFPNETFTLLPGRIIYDSRKQEGKARIRLTCKRPLDFDSCNQYTKRLKQVFGSETLKGSYQK